jgi:dTDP-4-dehydrorhamnose reductase
VKVWVTGSGGLIGGYLLQTAAQVVPAWTVVGLTRQTFDLEDASAVRAAFRRDEPELVIHCAGLTRAAACQQNPALARRLNVEATALLADLASAIALIFLSTDLVFDGRRGNYDESDRVNPLNAYGETKAAAEQIVLANPGHTVLRTSLNFGSSRSGDRAFNEEMRRAWRAGETLRLFTDEFRNPIAAEVTAQFVWRMARLGRPGLYHLAGSERLSRWEIGRLLAAHWPDLEARMERSSSRAFPGPPRAADTSLNCSRIEVLLSTPLPCFSAWLAGARAPAPTDGEAV